MATSFVFVTGGSGLVGYAICERLLAAGRAVHGTRFRRPLPAGVVPVGVALDDVNSLAAALDGATAVVHAAAVFEGEDLERTNVAATAALAAAAERAGVPRFVLLSSAMVYAPGEFHRADEAHPVQPFDPYGTSKLAAERAVASVFSGLRTALRPATVYGRADARFARLAVALTCLPVLPESGVPIDLVHSADVALAVDAAIGAPRLAPAYNVTGPASAPFGELARTVCGALGKAPELVSIERAAGIVPAEIIAAATTERTLSIERARRELGYAPSRDWRVEMSRLR